MREFNMKDLREAKKIIRWMITREKVILKINQKEYIQDLPESEGMIFCHAIVPPVEVNFTIVLDYVKDH